MRVSIEAHPNARTEHVELENDELRVWVRARAVDGQANAAIEQAIALALGLRPHQVHIVRGKNSRHKLVELEVADLESPRDLLRQRADHRRRHALS